MKTMNKLPLVGILLAFAMTVTAGNVKMKTAKATGTKISIAVNVGIPVTVTWGDGSTEQVTSTGQPQEFTVKSESLTLSSDGDITSLYVAENELTELTFNSLTTLKTLVCCENKLEKLDLSNCKELVSLDCQGNKLTSLTIGSSNISDLNIADNQLTSNGLRSGANVTSLVCGNNKLSTILYLSSMTGLKTLFCQDNQLTSLGLSKCTELEQLLAYGNQLKTFNAKALVNMKDLWLGGNQLEELDLSAQNVLVGLSVPDNKLTTILWNKDCSKTLTYADLSGNGLFLNSFPTIYNSTKKIYTVDAALTQATPYELLTDVNVGERSEAMQNYLARNAFNASVSSELVLTDATGAELVKDEDYTYSAYKFTFHKGHNGVVLTVMPKNYLEVVLKTKPFNIIDPTGIETITSSQTMADDGVIYDLSGRKMASSQLKPGIYVINGKKVVIR